jgi:excisionase family DNA binding protein
VPASRTSGRRNNNSLEGIAMSRPRNTSSLLDVRGVAADLGFEEPEPPSATKELIIGLRQEVVALTGAVRSLEQRIPARVVSVEEAAKHLSVSVQTIRRWCKSGRLPYVRRGRELRIDLTKVRAVSGDDIRRGLG